MLRCSPPTVAPATPRRQPLFPRPSTGSDSPSNHSETSDSSPYSASRRSVKRVRSFHGTPSRLSAANLSASILGRQSAFAFGSPELRTRGSPSILGRQGSFHGANSPFARPRPGTAPPASPSDRTANHPSPIKVDPSNGPRQAWGELPPAPAATAPAAAPIEAPAAAPATTTSFTSAFRPPPIRTVTSLEVPGWGALSSSTPLGLTPGSGPTGMPPPISIPSCPSPLHWGRIAPPPIRTMASLEDWGNGSDDKDGRSSSASVQLVHSSSTHSLLGAPPELRPPELIIDMANNASGIVAPPPSPRGRGGGGFFMRNGFQNIHPGAHAFARNEPPMSLVAPNLYVGDEHAASNCMGLISAGITHVLNCSSLSNPLEGVAGAPAHYMQLGLLDNTSDLPRMQEALGTGVEYISSAIASGGTVLVHCHRGISRSATLAIAYLCRATQQPAELVFEQMRTKRKVIDPNLGYWVALKEWERRVLPPMVLRAHSSRERMHSSPIPEAVQSAASRAAAASPGPRPLSRAG